MTFETDASYPAYATMGKYGGWAIRDFYLTVGYCGYNCKECDDEINCTL